MFVVMLISVLLVGCTTTTRTVYVPVSPTASAVPADQVPSATPQQPQVVYAPAPYGYGNGAVRVSNGRFLGIFPFTSSSTSWSYHIVEPVYVAPPVDVYYSYPSFSAGFEWRSGRLDRHRTWGPSRQADCRPNHGNHRGGHGRP